MIEEPNSLLELKNILRISSMNLSHWKLLQSAKWASEALIGLCEITDDNMASKFIDENESPLKNRHTCGSIPTKTCSRYRESSLDKLDLNDYDTYILASNLFDCKEFDRCALYLKHTKQPNLKFLRLYSRYLSWDKKTQETCEDILVKSPDIAQNEPGSTINLNDYDSNYSQDIEKEEKSNIQAQMVVDLGTGEKISISVIHRELNDFIHSYENIDNEFGFALLYYLKGILLKKQGLSSEAIQSFVKSLELYTYNWTCWLELISCLTRVDESVLLLRLLSEKFNKRSSEVIMLRFFKLLIFREFGGEFDGFIEELDSLLTIFPGFSYLKTQHALVNYQYMDYVNAELIFDEIFKTDPYRLDDLDTYSNILYVIQKPYKLAYLAQLATSIDRYRYETCCIVANYFSAKQHHEKAIMYFRRALTLNKACTNAWTLMGHEFVEMKNSHAAIECYRRAVDINPRDFKAWYGLGQAYEVLDMCIYALYYFQKSCSLKPLDKRMWQALGNCYDKLSQNNQAIKCFQRASQLSNDQDVVILFRLANLYERLKNIKSCKSYMLKCFEIEQLCQNIVMDECDKARLWLARYEVKQRNFSVAYNYASGITHGTSQEIEEARTIARECRRWMEC